MDDSQLQSSTIIAFGFHIFEFVYFFSYFLNIFYTVESVILENNIFTWKPGYSDSGTYGVEFTVSDGELNDSETITITVKDVNRAPEISLISPQNNSIIKDINQTIDILG